jgi:hypothetical protein
MYIYFILTIHEDVLVDELFSFFPVEYGYKSVCLRGCYAPIIPAQPGYLLPEIRDG